MSGSIPHAVEAHRFSNERLIQSGNAYGQNSAGDSQLDGNPTSARAVSDYTVSLSDNAQSMLANEQQANDPSRLSEQSEQTALDEQNDKSQATDNNEDNEQGLTEDEQNEVDDLKARDEEVRIHEQAHATAGGQHAGAPSYSYEQGPDGKRYITDGEVQIDVSTVSGDPQATIDKMKQVYRAALAPAEPSSADRSVANEAQQNIAQAMSELVKQISGSEQQANTRESLNNKSRSTLQSAYTSADSKQNSGTQVDLVA